mgnify:CR=1 FL=1
MQNKKSSVISHAVARGNDLVITFVGGKTYTYTGASKHAKPLNEAPSAGRYFREQVLNKFAFTAA